MAACGGRCRRAWAFPPPAPPTLCWPGGTPNPPDLYITRAAAQRAFDRAVYHDDPLKRRLLALWWAGYVRFTKKERSLDVGSRVRAWQTARSD